MAQTSTGKDKLVLDLTYDNELRDYMLAKEVGEKCLLEINASLDEVTNDQAVLSVDEATVISGGMEKKMGPEGPEVSGKDVPAAAILMSLAGPKGKKGGY
jgi:hypothetical protein